MKALNASFQRLLLYAVIQACIVLGDKLVPILTEDKWPTPQGSVIILIAVIAAVATTIRAHIDGSHERQRINGQTPTHSTVGTGNP